MRPARIPSFPQLTIGWAFFGLVVLGCSSASDNTPKGIIPGMALGKFCHDLNRGGLPVVLTLQFGDPAIKTISARTGICAPLKGMPCLEIPVGRVPLKVMEGDKVLATRAVILSNGPDGGPPNEYVFQPVITNLQVAITGGRITVPPVCQDLDFTPPDGGAGDGGGSLPGEAGVPADGPAAETGVVPPDAGADTAAPVVDAPPADAAVAADVAEDAAPVADAPATD